MRFTLFGLAAIVIIGAIAVFLGPLFISTDDLRDSLFAQVESATGYRLRVSGPVQVSLFPSLDLVAEDVGLAQSGADDGTELARAKSLRFGLQLSALLGGNVKMTEVALIDPVILLPQAEKRASREDGGETDGAPESIMPTLQALSLDKLSIKNGTVILPGPDGTPGKRIEALDLEAAFPSSDAPLTFDVTALIDGDRFAAAGSLGNFGQFLDGATVPVSLAMDVPSYVDQRTVVDGTVSYRDASLALGKFTAKAGDKVLSGSASYKGNLVTLHPFNFSASGNTLSGSLVADLSGAIPAVNVAVSGQSLNLDSLLAKSNAAPGSAGTGGAGPGWSDDMIDFTPLRAVTARVKLSTGQIVYNGIKIANANLDASISGGKLKAELRQFQLYGGAGTLALDIDASGKLPAQRLRLSLANFDAYPFLKDSAGFQNIEGAGAITLDLAMSGASQRAMVSSMGGGAKFEFTNGAIRGINIAKTVRNLSTGVLTGWEANDAEKTDFAALGASFTIAKGQAQTADLRLLGPLVRMSGAGTVDLPAQMLKFKVDPQIVASLEGQGGTSDLQGLGVPVIVAGPWARPSIYPDIEGILKDPVAAYQQLNRLGAGLVSLPGAATGGVDVVSGLIKKGKQDPLGNIGQFLGAQPADQAAPSSSIDQQPVTEANPAPAKKGKKRQADARSERSQAAEAAAKQALQSLFGN
ncbi:MAG TPA: AsmA family protein [Alphaproteobacteria bacterium]|nr:AsmA family protein [Alphaproteobacteria bacterium]